MTKLTDTQLVILSAAAGRKSRAVLPFPKSLKIGKGVVGIIGLGSAGTEVARRAAAFGMDVIATKNRDSDKPPFVSQVWKPDRFHDLLALSDIVVICAPLTHQTQGLFDLAAFHQMRRHALLINIARGQIVQEDALLQALEENLIGGAGLDVFTTEPLPDDSPLWAMKNVVLTSHMAGRSSLHLDRVIDLLCTNLERYSSGLPLLNVVDKREGY